VSICKPDHTESCIHSIVSGEPQRGPCIHSSKTCPLSSSRRVCRSERHPLAFIHLKTCPLSDQDSTAELIGIILAFIPSKTCPAISVVAFVPHDRSFTESPSTPFLHSFPHFHYRNLTNSTREKDHTHHRTDLAFIPSNKIVVFLFAFIQLAVVDAVQKDTDISPRQLAELLLHSFPRKLVLCQF
jgi:hypothetical protein